METLLGAGAVKSLLIRLIAAGLMLTLADAVLPKGGAGEGAGRLIRLALAAAVLLGTGP